MTTTTRVPLEPFLPLGSLDSDSTSSHPATLGSQPFSTLSPLLLPRAEAAYLHHVSAPSRSPCHPPPLKTSAINSPSWSSNIKDFSPSFPSFRGSPPAPTARFLLSNPVRETNHHLEQLRSSSLSPRHGMVSVGRDFSRGEPREGLASGHVSLSVDPAHQPSSAHTVHRLLQQNARIRGAWEAERKYLEANRERAEEVYKEEQVMMENDRLAWEEERAQLLRQVEALGQERAGWNREKSRLLQLIEGLQSRVLTLEARPHGQSGANDQGPSPSILIRDHSVSGHAREAADASHEVGGSTFLPRINTSTLIPGPAPSNTASVPSVQFSSPDSIKSTFNPACMVPLIPGSLSPTTNAMGLSGLDHGHVPVVDVREIHPELEGIPIKATAIQRPTFRDGPTPMGSRTTSRTGSPTENQRSPLDKQESRQQTLETLAAPETARLTMHAGHTPSHSMSMVPTGVPSGVSTAASSGGCTTPLASQPKIAALKTSAADEDDRRDSSVSMSELVEPAPSHQTQMDVAHDHAGHWLMQPTEDRELVAPLMIRNIPTTDEIFLRRLSDKLEEIQRSPEIAIPAVLKDAVFHDGSSEDFSLPSPLMATTGSVAAATETTSSRNKSPQNDAELEIPLRLKKSCNFGAPFGEYR